VPTGFKYYFVFECSNIRQQLHLLNTEAHENDYPLVHKAGFTSKTVLF